MAALAAFLDSMPFRAALAAGTLWSFTIYKKMNERAPEGDVLMTRLDDAIPFLPVFSVPYLLFLPYVMWLVVYGIVATPFYAQIAASAVAVQLAGAVVYRIHQTHVPRPKVVGADVFSRLTRFVYAHDRPYCNYPSFHVAYSVLCAYWTAIIFPVLLVPAAVFSLSIVLSTMFIKQHAMIDVVGGVTLASLCLLLVR
jgi:membrane-associated phospholipid phosphatase